jgi:MFS family permease
LIGGRLCDLYGRKRIYQFDMLFYAFGMLWLVFAQYPMMIVVGFILVGLDHAARFVTGQTLWVDGGAFTRAPWPQS